MIKTSWSFLSDFVAAMKPGAQSVMTVMGPGCPIGVVREIMPDLRSSSFSDGIRAVAIKEVKWSIMIRMF